MTQRVFIWVCPSCRSLLRLETEEEDHDDEARGVIACGWAGYEPRCPMCTSKMVTEDEIAVWYCRKRRPVSGFTLSTEDFEAWRAEQPVSAHAEGCEVYDREDADCGCGHDVRKKGRAGVGITVLEEGKGFTLPGDKK